MPKTLQATFPISVSPLICNCTCHLKSTRHGRQAHSLITQRFQSTNALSWLSWNSSTPIMQSCVCSFEFALHKRHSQDTCQWANFVGSSKNQCSQRLLLGLWPSYLTACSVYKVFIKDMSIKIQQQWRKSLETPNLFHVSRENNSIPTARGASQTICVLHWQCNVALDV